ncbi:MAG: hypothetical protein FJW36_16970 [Acidobacteria bacterium]|nr:hypothetical protein [Acidobacteriota bacterium]
MSTLKVLTLALLFCLLSSCFPTEQREVVRGKKNGRPFQKVIITKTLDGEKLSRVIQDYDYDRDKKAWVPIGPARDLLNGDAKAELSNVQNYDGTESDPPNSASIATPAYIYIADNSGNNTVIVIDARTLAPVSRILVPGFTSSLAASPDGLTIAAPSANQLILIDVLTNRIVRSLALPSSSSVQSIHSSLDGSLLYLMDRAAGIRIVQVSSLTTVEVIPMPSAFAQFDSSTMSPDGDYLFIRGGGPTSTLIFDITTRSFTVGANTGRANLFSQIPCVFHSTGKEVYCVSTNGIAIIDAATMTLSGSITIPRGESVYRLYTVDGGDYLLHTTNTAVRMIDPASRPILASLSPGAREIFTTAFPVSIF